MSSHLSLAVAPDAHGRTRVAALDYTFPLRTTAPMYLEAGDPGMAYVYLQNPSGALFDGDHHVLDVALAGGSRLHLTTQSAARIAAAAASGTSQQIDVDLAPGSYLEHLPDALVPMTGARYEQRTTVTLHGDACYLGAELLAPGRVAHGEYLAYDRVRLVTTVLRDDGARCRDALQLGGGGGSSRPGVLGSRAHVGTVLAAGPQHVVAALGAALLSVTDEQPATLAGIGELPDGLGVLVRVLGDRPGEVRTLLRALTDRARHVLVGLPLAVGRK